MFACLRGVDDGGLTHSGVPRVGFDAAQTLILQRYAHRAGYGARSSHIVPYIVCI